MNDLIGKFIKQQDIVFHISGINSLHEGRNSNTFTGTGDRWTPVLYLQLLLLLKKMLWLGF